MPQKDVYIFLNYLINCFLLICILFFFKKFPYKIKISFLNLKLKNFLGFINSVVDQNQEIIKK
jgi:hypothetical protein